VDFSRLTDPSLKTDALGLSMPLNMVLHAQARLVVVWGGQRPEDEAAQLSRDAG
jgi:hypothetical protein